MIADVDKQLNDKTANNLAEQIAALLKAESRAEGGDDLRLTIEKLNQRLDRLESKLESSDSRPQIENRKLEHPALQRFTSLGEIADVILDRLNNQKECPYEPAGKPCDNCSMCSSRGF